ncbi:MAG: chloramphenicol acetyltransferase [Clostridium butyricum]|nr:chloramphenicol acetyltransferase [Clostridium butyricum]
MNYKVIDMEKYYRKGVYRHFTQDCKCSTSITSKIDVAQLVEYSKRTNTKFYINFLYILSKVLNSREDYRMQYLYDKQQLIIFDKINPAHYIFHEDTETCTVVYTEYFDEYEKFYNVCAKEIEKAKQTREYGLDPKNHPNYFDASYISWLSYESLNVELPDGYLHFIPIINWGKYKAEKGRFLMPVSVRLNHAVADGYLNAKVFMLLEKEIKNFCMNL